MTEVGNLLEKITVPMIIIIRVWIDGWMFLIFGRIYKNSLFFRVSTLDSRSLHVETLKEPPISNSKIR